jgi:uncharacterized protein (TIGR02270 family)
MAPAVDEMMLWDIVEEHLDEAAFLYWMRKIQLQAPDHDLATIASGPEARLLAHVDALVVGGSPVCERMLLPVLTDERADPERVAAAALALLAGDFRERAAEALVAALPRLRGDRLDALCDALCLARVDAAAPRVLALVGKSSDPAVVAAGLRILAALRADPGTLLPDWLASDKPAIVQGALSIVMAVRRGDCLGTVGRLVDSTDPGTRDRALDAALVLGSSEAGSICVERAFHPTKADAHALLLCGLLGGPAEHAQLATFLERGTHVADVLWAIGFAGRPEHADAALPFLEHGSARVAKLAGETFVSITGHAPRREPPGPQADADVAPIAFEDDDLDADLVPSAIDRLPRIDPAQAKAWWDSRRAGFAASGRYILGRAFSLDALAHALRHGSARRGIPWHLAVRIASRGHCVLAEGGFYVHLSSELDALVQFHPAWLRRLHGPLHANARPVQLAATPRSASVLTGRS